MTHPAYIDAIENTCGECIPWRIGRAYFPAFKIRLIRVLVAG